MAPQQPPPRKRLTLFDLASYDDFLTDALVDKVFFWNTIRKSRSKFTPGRAIRESDVTSILFEEVVCCGDERAVGIGPKEQERKGLVNAEEKLLALPGFKLFMAKLKNDAQRDDFKKHMRRYIPIWRPDCPFEVTTTNRYTISTHEASTTARRDIKKGETIKFLCGTLVSMTPEEERDLDLAKQDFSIVRSARRKTSSLFLGPARFTNHDCNPNAKLSTVGHDGMQIVAIKDIKMNEEITVSYGDDYFGQDNQECLCATCELHQRNGWLSTDTKGDLDFATALSTEENDLGPYSFRRKRLLTDSASASRSHSRSARVDIESSTPVGRLKRASQEEESPSPRKRARVTIGFESPVQSVTSTPRHASPEHKTLRQLRNFPLSRRTSSPLVRRETQEPEDDEVDLIKVDDLDDASQQESILDIQDATAKWQHDKPLRALPHIAENWHCLRGPDEVSDPIDRDTPSLVNTDPTCSTSSSCQSTTSLNALSVFSADNIREGTPTSTTSILSDLESDLELDDKTQTVIDRPRQKRKYTKRPPRPISSYILPSNLENPKERQPGDYLPRHLLATSHSKYPNRVLQCMNSSCEALWLHTITGPDPIDCPRCERHSKLYGFRWPQTTKAESGDARIMDWRTVRRDRRPVEVIPVLVHVAKVPKRRGRPPKVQMLLGRNKKVVPAVTSRGRGRKVEEEPVTVRARGRPGRKPKVEEPVIQKGRPGRKPKVVEIVRGIPRKQKVVEGEPLRTKGRPGRRPKVR